MLAGSWLARLIAGDGASTAPQAPATEIDQTAEQVAPAGRRERAVGDGDEMVHAIISAKALHGWLQNRQQTLHPLTMNVAALPAESQVLLARLLAVALLAGRPARVPDIDLDRCRSWLASVGAGPDATVAFDQATMAPPPLSRTLEAAIARDLGAYAYVMGLVASDPRLAASLRFLDYLEARLDLPSAVVRSAARRYRR